MFGVVTSPSSVLRAALVTVVLLGVAIALSVGLGVGGLALLTVILWAVVVGAIGVGAFLVRAGRPLAGAGAIITGLSLWIAFFVHPQAWLLWTFLFFVGVILIARGTAEDTADRAAWPLLLPRVAIGWALVDNAQDHFWTGWLPSGGGFLQSATGATNRQPLYFLDPAYQEFLRTVVLPAPDTWAALVMCGELAFGVMLAVGFLTPVGALGAMWLNTNYMLMRGFVAHGAYVDKAFFAVELFCLIALAGQAYGLDATLRRFVPASIARTVMGLPATEAEPPLPARQAPLPT